MIAEYFQNGSKANPNNPNMIPTGFQNDADVGPTLSETIIEAPESDYKHISYMYICASNKRKSVFKLIMKSLQHACGTIAK